MTSRLPAGFQEVPHTADWELKVWAPDFLTLLEHAARGMYHLCEARMVSEPRISRRIELAFDELETLLVDYLSELLFLTESEGLGFDQFKLQIEGNRLIADISGAKLKSLAKEIKAVTYHRIEIRDTGKQMEANIVFDV